MCFCVFKICDFSRNQWSWEWRDKNIVGFRLSVCKSPHSFFFFAVVFVLISWFYSPYRISTPELMVLLRCRNKSSGCGFALPKADFSNLIKNNTNFQDTHTLMRGRGQLRTCQSGKSVQERRSARTKTVSLPDPSEENRTTKTQNCPH